MKRQSIYSSTLLSGVGGGTSTHLRQLHGASYNPGQQIAEMVPGGALHRAASFLMFAQAVASLQSHDLLTLITDVPLTTGLACTGGAVFRSRRRVDGGSFDSGSTHMTLTSTLGWAAISQISCSQRGLAEATLSYWALFDGTNAPFVNAASQALGGSTPQQTSQYSLGPVYLNGTLLPDMQSIEIMPGLNYQTADGDGDVWPRVGAIYTATPTLRVRSKDPTLAAAIGGSFLVTGTNLAVYLREVVSGQPGRTADATAQHIKITMSAGSLQADGANVSGNDDWENGLIALPSAAISVSTASAIP